MNDNPDDQLIRDENILLGHYIDEVDNGDGSFFQYIGLSAAASWSEFRRHYDKDGTPDLDRAGDDLAGYPPFAERV